MTMCRFNQHPAKRKGFVIMTQTFKRNEADFCPACGQCNELHGDSNPPGPRCKWRDSNEHGLDTEHYREDEPGHDELGRAGYGEGYK